MIYRDTTETDIRRGCEAFLATEKLLAYMGLAGDVHIDFDPDCAETIVYEPSVYSSICVVGPQEEGTGYNVTRHGENQFKYTAVSAAIAAVQMVIEWKVRHLPTIQPDHEAVNEMAESQ